MNPCWSWGSLRCSIAFALANGSEGQLLGTYFLLAGLVRFGVEFFRGDPRGPALFAGMPSTLVIALSMSVVGGCLLSWGLRQEK